jgi:hypothetical protein
MIFELVVFNIIVILVMMISLSFLEFLIITIFLYYYFNGARRTGIWMLQGGLQKLIGLSFFTPHSTHVSHNVYLVFSLLSFLQSVISPLIISPCPDAVLEVIKISSGVILLFFLPGVTVVSGHYSRRCDVPFIVLFP